MRYRIEILLAIGTLAACGSADDAARGRTTPMPDGLPGVYAGELPCGNCAAIAATLWLRADGGFVLKQRYVGTDGAPDDNAYALGRWSWDEHDAVVTLAAPGPQRRLRPLDEQRVSLQTGSQAEHVLVRDPHGPAFSDRVRLAGESIVRDGNGVFTECLTGLTFSVASQGVFNELRRQHRRLNPRGIVTLTEVEARLATSDADDTAETLIVERVIGLKPGSGC